jgi:Rieske [2Fe-2S] domain
MCVRDPLGGGLPQVPVVTFSVAGKGNCAVIAEVSYVYVTVRGGGFVMRAQCPHRGGPLHLASLTPDAARLVCPWHGGKVSVARLRGEIPAVRVGDQVTAVFRDPPERTEACLEYRPLSVDLAAPADPATPDAASATKWAQPVFSHSR